MAMLVWIDLGKRRNVNGNYYRIDLKLEGKLMKVCKYSDRQTNLLSHTQCVVFDL